MRWKSLVTWNSKTQHYKSAISHTTALNSDGLTVVCRLYLQSCLCLFRLRKQHLFMILILSQQCDDKAEPWLRPSRGRAYWGWAVAGLSLFMCVLRRAGPSSSCFNSVHLYLENSPFSRNKQWNSFLQQPFSIVTLVKVGLELLPPQCHHFNKPPLPAQ